ncbi:MAG: hypothetical protein ACXVCO_19155, partial [Ktedonobacterales bacterium]
VATLLGISCLLVALVLPWTHREPGSVLMAAPSDDDSLLRLLFTGGYAGYNPALTVFILYLLPLLGSCLVAVEALRAWQGRAATRSSSALLLLGMGCALFGLAASYLLALLAGISIRSDMVPPPQHSAGPGVGLASLGFGAVVAGGTLLAIGALLHRWTLRRNDRRASATTTG